MKGFHSLALLRNLYRVPALWCLALLASACSSSSPKVMHFSCTANPGQLTERIAGLFAQNRYTVDKIDLATGTVQATYENMSTDAIEYSRYIWTVRATADAMEITARQVYKERNQTGSEATPDHVRYFDERTIPAGRGGEWFTQIMNGLEVICTNNSGVPPKE